MNEKKAAAFLASAEKVELVYGPEAVARAQSLCDVAATSLADAVGAVAGDGALR